MKKRAKVFYDEAKEIFAEASMNLREWLSNSPTVMQSIKEDDRCKDTIIKVLGIPWNSETDTLVFKMDPNEFKEVNTLRQMLKSVCKNFDPLGYFSPVSIRLRMLIQEVCTRKPEWDKPISAEVKDKWNDVCKDLREASLVHVPRYVGTVPDSKVTLCCFVDASPKAYSTAVYLRAETDSQVYLHLVFASNLLSPKKTVSIPRLELMSALIGTRAVKFLKLELRLREQPHTFLFTDSTCVLDAYFY